MKKKNNKTSKGFTLVEVILAVVVLGVLALVLGNAFSDATDGAVDKVKTNNAAKMTALLRDIDSLGGDVSPGGGDVDTSSMGDIIEALQGGVEVQGLNIQLDDEPNPAAYTYAAAPHTVAPILREPNVAP